MGISKRKCFSTVTLNNLTLHRKRELIIGTETKIEEDDFPLEEVTEYDLFEYRAGNVPGFVLKSNGHYYYTAIPKNFSLNSQNLLGCHLCSKNSNPCKRFWPYPDDQNGCEKVRDRFIEAFKMKTYSSIFASKRIEKYPFITLGYEIFNSRFDCFVVVKCTHYAKN